MAPARPDMAHRLSPPSSRSSARKLGRAGACALALFLLAIGASAPVAGAATPPGLVVIVNTARPQTSLSRSFVAAVFLKKTTVWDDGATVRPVDLRPDAPIRTAFSDQILQRPLGAVRMYWEQRIFSGRDVPPIELDSEDAVVQYVATHPDAIGYVSSTTRLAGVKAVGIQ